MESIDYCSYHAGLFQVIEILAMIILFFQQKAAILTIQYGR